MRRTRGDIGLRFRLAGVACAVFFAAGPVTADAFVLPDDVAVADLGGEDFGADEVSWVVLSAEGAGFSGAACAEGATAVGTSCKDADASKGVPLRNQHSPARASTLQLLRPNRNTFLFFARRRECQNLICRSGLGPLLIETLTRLSLAALQLSPDYFLKFAPMTERSSSARLRTTSF